MWPLLAEKGADPAVLDALEAEHAGIDPLLASVAADLRALADGTGDAATRERLADTTVRLRDGLGAHLAHEERDGMALVQQHLTPADWDRLHHEVFAKDYAPREVPAVPAGSPTGCPRRRCGACRMPARCCSRSPGSWAAAPPAGTRASSGGRR